MIKRRDFLRQSLLGAAVIAAPATLTNQTYASDLVNRNLTETYNLGAVSLMRNGKKLTYDPNTRQVTNDDEGNKLLSRDTRKGWEFV